MRMEKIERKLFYSKIKITSNKNGVVDLSSYIDDELIDVPYKLQKITIAKKIF